MRLLFALLIGLSFLFTAFADDATTATTPTAKEASTVFDISSLVAKLPCLHQTALYSIPNNEVRYAMSFTLISFFNDHLNIDAGYCPSGEIIAAASLKLFNIGKIVKIPLLEYITFEPFGYYGREGIGSGKGKFGEEDYGAGIKFLSIKF